MPRLTRKNIKVFAGSATNNGVFGSLQANNPTTTSDVEQLQSLSAWEQGWNSATETSEELPPLEEIQGVEYVTTYQQAYLMQEGVPEWSSSVTYYVGSVVKEVTSAGFKIYNSLTDNNTGNLLSDTFNWKKVMDSDDLYAFDNTVVHKTGNETVSGVKTFSSSPIIPTATTGDSSTKAASTEFVTDAINTINNAVVHLTGDETIGGVKTFNNPIHFNSSVFVDAAGGDEGGEIEFAKAPNSSLLGNVKLDVYRNSMRIFGPASNGQTNNVMNADIEQNALFIPSSDKIDTAISTAGINKSSDGYVKLGNGIIIQWGRSSQRTITYPIPFSTDTSFSIVVNNQAGTDGYGRPDRVENLTRTSCMVGADSEYPVRWLAIGY